MLEQRHARHARVIFFRDFKAPTEVAVLGGLIHVYWSRIPLSVIIEFNILVQTLMIVVPKYFTTILQNNSFPSFSPF